MQSLLALKPLIRECLAFAPYRLIACLCLMLVSSVASGAGILLIIPMLASVGVDVGVSTASQWVIEKVEFIAASVGVTLNLSSILVLYLVIIFIVAGLGFLNSVWSAALRQSFIMSLRNKLAKRLFLTRWQYLNQAHMSDFIRLLTSQVQMAGASIYLVLNLISSTVLVLVYLMFSIFLSGQLTAVALICGMGFVVLLWPLNKKIRSSGRVGLKASTDIHRAIFDDLANLKVIKSYVAEQHYLQRITDNNSVIEQQQIRLAGYNALTRFVYLVGAAIIFAIVFYGAINWFTLPIANVLVVLFIFTRLLPHISSIQSTLQSIIHQAPSYQDLLDQSAELVTWSELPSQSAIAPRLDREIELRGLTFTHFEADQVIIDKLSATIRRNQTIAITGPSGAGKSTLADLVSGLLAPTSGDVLVDGDALTDENRRAWRTRVAYVMQDVFLFHDSVRNNLSWVRELAGSNSGRVTDDEIWQVLRLSAADEFVKNLPQGLDTLIGDRGVKLSGGERQRLTLARALLSKPDLLILDEATSALDRGSELKIRDALMNLDGQLTIIIIAHNETTIEHVAHRIELPTG